MFGVMSHRVNAWESNDCDARTEAKMRLGGAAGVIVLVWLVIGVLAAWQRGYFKGETETCATGSTIALTVVAGPLNYAGLRPQVAECRLPHPS